MEGHDSILLSKGFMTGLTGRFFGGFIFITGLVASFFDPLVGTPLLFFGSLPYSRYETVLFFPANTTLQRRITFYFIPLVNKRETIKINHVSLTRDMKDGSPLSEVSVGDTYFYNVMLIFNDRRKEVMYAVNDEKDAMKFSLTIAKKLRVKIFYAGSTPQKWIDPVTGKETIAEFKRKR